MARLKMAPVKKTKVWLVAYTRTVDQSEDFFKMFVCCVPKAEDVHVSKTMCKTACK